MPTNYQYPSNSTKSKTESKPKTTEEKPKFEKVISGNATVKKKGLGSRLKDILFAEDFGTVKNYIWSDVVVPAAKKLLTDVVRDGADMIVYGQKGRSRTTASSGIPMVDYNKRFNNNNSVIPSSANNGFSFDDLSFTRRSDAEEVLNSMRAAVGRFGMVSVMDMYDMAGRTAPFTSDKYGWMGSSLDSAEVSRTYDGNFVIRLPKAMMIDY